MTLVMLLVVLCTIAVTACVWYVHSDAQRIWVVHSIVLLVVSICFAGGTLLIFLVASGGASVGGGIASFIILVAIISVIIPSGLALFFVLQSSRRWLHLLFAVISPFVLWGSMVLGDSFSPEKQIINRADAIILALEAYRTATGSFPETLDVLLTGYLQELPEVTGPFDWFYTSSKDTYRLGYIPTVDRWTYTIYSHDSEHATWSFDVHQLGEGPFIVPPTPFPSY